MLILNGNRSKSINGVIYIIRLILYGNRAKSINGVIYI